MLQRSIKIHHTQGNHVLTNCVFHLQGSKLKLEIESRWCNILNRNLGTRKKYTDKDLKDIRREFAEVVMGRKVEETHVVNVYNAIVKDFYKYGAELPKLYPTSEYMHNMGSLYPIRVHDEHRNGGSSGHGVKTGGGPGIRWEFS